VLAKEILETITDHSDRSVFIAIVNRLSGFIGDRRHFLLNICEVMALTLSEDLLKRFLVELSSSNVAQFIEQLHLVDRNMDLEAANFSLPLSDLSAGAGSGSSKVEGTPFGRPSTSSGESASDAAVAVNRGPDPAMLRFRSGPGDNIQDANAVKPMLTRPDAILDLAAAGAADLDADADRTQTQAVIDGAATVTATAAAAKSDSDDDSAPADSRKRQLDEDDDRKPAAKRS
jgi:hypothetical protein